MADTYNIKLPDGMDVSVPAWATEDTLAKVAKALKVTDVGSVSAVIKKFGGKGSTDKKTVVGSAGAVAGSLDKVSESSAKAQMAFNAVAATAETVSTIGATLANTGGSFESLNPLVDLATDGMGSLAKLIPIVGDGLAGLIGLLGDLVKMANVQFDEFLNAFDGVAMQGMGLQTSFIDLQKEALKGRISLTDLFSATQRAAGGVIALGGSFDEGVRRFTNIQNVLQENGGPFQMALESFGMSAVDTADFLADFLEEQSGNVQLSRLSNQQLAQSVFDVIKNQRQLAELTGRSVDEMKEERKQAMMNQQFQAKLQMLRNSGQEDEARALEEFVSGLPTAAARQSGMEMLVFNGALATATTNLANLATGGELQNSIASGFDAIFASGGKISEDQISKLIAPVGDAISLVAGDNSMLQIAAFGIAGKATELGTVVEELLPTARKIAVIQESAGATLAEVNARLIKATNDQIAALTSGGGPQQMAAISEFNKNLLTTRKNLDDLSTNIQALVLEQFEPLLGAYADYLTQVIGTINDFASGTGQFAPSTDTKDSAVEDSLEINGSILAGAAAGAAIGSLVPIIGTGIGGAAGAVIGYFAGQAYQKVEAIPGMDDFATKTFGGNSTAEATDTANKYAEAYGANTNGTSTKGISVDMTETNQKLDQVNNNLGNLVKEQKAGNKKIAHATHPQGGRN